MMQLYMWTTGQFMPRFWQPNTAFYCNFRTLLQ